MIPIRTTLLLILAAVLATAATYQEKSPLKEFYQAWEGQEDVTTMKMPGWIINTVSLAGGLFVSDPEVKGALKFGRKLNRIRMITVERSSVDISEELTALLEGSSYDTLIEIRDEHEHMQLLGRVNKRLKHDFLLIVQEPGETMVLDLETRMKSKDLIELLNYVVYHHVDPVTKQDFEKSL